MEDREKLKSLGISGKLLDVLLELRAVIDLHGLSEHESSQLLDIISSTGMEEVNKLSLLSEDSWGDFEYGNTIPGDYVRVRPDSYDSITGHKHNGRVGKITNISGRRVRIRYLGIKQSSSMDHPISNLQSPKHGIQLKTS